MDNLPYILALFFILLGVVAYALYIRERREGFINLKKLAKGSLATGAKAGFETLKSGGSVKDVAKTVLIKSLEDAYKEAMPQIEEIVRNSSQQKQAAYAVLKAGATTAFLSFKAGVNYKEIALKTVDACYNAAEPLLDAFIATRSPQEQEIIKSIRSGAGSAIGAYKSGQNPLDIAKAAGSPLLEAGMSRLDPSQQAMLKSLKDQAGSAYGAYKAGENPLDIAKRAGSPLLEAGLSRLDPSQQAMLKSLQAQAGSAYGAYKAGENPLDIAKRAGSPLLEAGLSRLDPSQQAMLKSLQAQAGSAYGAYKAGESPLDIAKATGSPILEAGLSYVEQEKIRARELPPAMANNPEVAKIWSQMDLDEPYKLVKQASPLKMISDQDKQTMSTAIQQAGFKNSAPLIMAKLNTMDKSEQAKFLVSRSGNAGILETYGK
jgi:hypothetical protein